MYLSIVSPIYNEVENIPLLYQAIVKSLVDLGKPWELLLIDDGSRDGSTQALMDLAKLDPLHIRVIVFRRNFGQTAAIAAGIDHAAGEIIVLMDADLQNDPADIPMMIAKIEEGYDVVSGWRRLRKDTYLTRTLPSHIANGLISWITGVHLHDYGCTLKAYRCEVIKGFKLYGEMHRFIPVFADLVGARIVEVEVHHHPRKFGKAKYGLERTIKVMLDLVTAKFLSSYANKPIYLFGGMGFILVAISLVLFLFLIIRRVFWGISVLGSPFFQTGTMLAILGVQSVLMGLIAELLVRTYHKSQNKPTYTIRTVVNLDEIYPEKNGKNNFPGDSSLN